MHLPRVLRTASFRLAALYCALFAASVIVLGGVVFLTTRAALTTQMRQHIASEIDALRTEYDAGGLPRLATATRARAEAGGAGVLDYLLIAPDGTHLVDTLELRVSRPGWTDRAPGSADAVDHDAGAVLALAVRLPDGAWLAVGDDRGRIDEVEEAILGAFAWALAATLALGIAGGLVLSRGFLARIDAITRTAEAIIAGDLRRRIATGNTGDDIDRLARTLNRMLDRIADLMESLHQVSNDIAHDLRTPLARLRQRLEAAQLLPGKERQAANEAAVADVDEILASFAALLRIAQIEAKTRRAGFRAVDLAAIARTVADAFTPDAEEQGRLLSLDAPDAVPLHGDAELLTQMIANLIENALRHTPPGTAIVVAAKAAPGGAMLIVADRGPGVPDDQRDRILRRFYRLEHSRTTPGSGLGLSLVAAIAELHSATLAVEDNAPGLRIAVRFPA